MSTRDDRTPRPAAGEQPTQLLEEHLAGLRAFVRLRLGRVLRSKEESVDLVQSVCREVLADLPRSGADSGAGFRDWLFRTAEFKIRDKWRYWQRDRRALDREVALDGERSAQEDEAALLAGLQTLFTPSRHAVAREELERLERAFTELPADAREVIVLARVHGLSHSEIAARMGRTELSTRSLLSRALARLALALDPRTAP